MKKLLLTLAIALFAIIGLNTTTSCNKLEPCEINHTGDVTFHDNGPSWVWNGCYLEIDWANGSYSSGTFYGSKTYYDKADGVADVYMEWEDDEGWYWNYGWISLVECSSVDAYCTWGKKSLIGDFHVTGAGSILKKEIDNIEDYRKTIK